MIGEDGSQAHTPGVNDCFMTETTQTSVTMHDLDLFSDDDIAEDGKEREDCWKRGLSIYDEKGNMIDFKAISEISDSCAAFVGMGYDDDFVAAVDEILIWVSS